MRYYSSTAVATNLVGDIDSTTNQFTVAGLTGYPDSLPWDGSLDPETDNEELVQVTDVNGNVLTVIRGYAGTTAIGHSGGAVFQHSTTHLDYQEPQDHIAATSGVHGVTGELVGTTDTQTLTGKTIDGADNTFSNIPNDALDDLAIAKVTDLQDSLDAKMDLPATSFSIGALLVGTGSGTYDILPAGNEGDVPTVQANGAVAYAAIPGTLLAVVDYEQAVTVPTVLAALDSTNLKITFTAPSNGKVLLRVSFDCYVASSGTLQLGFQNASGGAKIGRYWSNLHIFPEYYYTGSSNGTDAQDFLFSVAQVATGLVGGTSYTLNLVGSFGTAASLNVTNACIEAWAVPS